MSERELKREIERLKRRVKELEEGVPIKIERREPQTFIYAPIKLPDGISPNIHVTEPISRLYR